MSGTRGLPFRCSAVVIDVDGTSVDDEKRLTSRAWSAVAEPRASGMAFPIIINRRPPRGLRVLLEPLGITIPIIGFVIGDGGNDAAMFERSGLGIAMGNASPEVHKAAEFVPDSNREEGLVDAVERYVLGGGRSSKQPGAAGARGRA